MICGLNHLTLTVSDLDSSLAFYQDVLEMEGHVRWDKGAYLSSPGIWLCLNLGVPCPSQDYSHVALSVEPDDFEQVKARILAAGAKIWQENVSEGDSHYFLDPDGHKLEIHTGGLEARLTSLRQQPYKGLKWLAKDNAADFL